jgi:hypothetical protein
LDLGLVFGVEYPAVPLLNPGRSVCHPSQLISRRTTVWDTPERFLLSTKGVTVGPYPGTGTGFAAGSAPGAGVVGGRYW